MKITEMTNPQLRALSGQANEFGNPTTNAMLAGHEFDARRLAVRIEQDRDSRKRDPIYTLGEARASARYNRTERSWMRYGAIKQAVVSPLSVKLP